LLQAPIDVRIRNEDGLRMMVLMSINSAPARLIYSPQVLVRFRGSCRCVKLIFFCCCDGQTLGQSGETTSPGSNGRWEARRAPVEMLYCAETNCHRPKLVHCAVVSATTAAHNKTLSLERTLSVWIHQGVASRASPRSARRSLKLVAMCLVAGLVYPTMAVPSLFPWVKTRPDQRRCEQRCLVCPASFNR
jgi:hypothetical protein